MSEVFSRILLPVDFTPETEITIKRAIELIEPAGSSIHLIHILNPFRILVSSPYEARFLFSPQRSSYYKQQEMKLEQWRQTLAETLNKTKVTSEMIIGKSVEDAIIRESKRINPDLIIIGKHSFNSELRFINAISAPRIVDNSGCTVLIVKPAKFYSRVHTLVIPVGSMVPQQTIHTIASLSRKLNFFIYLVAVPENTSQQTTASGQALLETFRMLKRIPNCQVECRVINDNSLMKASWRFAGGVQADMVLIHPDLKATVPSNEKQHQRGLQPLSGLKILAEKPYEHNN